MDIQPKPDSSRKIMIKLCGLIVAMMIVFGLMIYLHRSFVAVPTPEAEYLKTAPASDAPFVKKPVKRFDDQINLPPQLPSYLTNPKTLDSVVDYVEEPPREALMNLLYQVWQSRDKDLAKEADPELTWQRLSSSPSDHRGNTLVIKGRLLRPPQVIDFPADEGSPFLSSHISHVYDEGFNEYTVYTIEEPSARRTNDPVEFPAFFLMMGKPMTEEAKPPAVVVAFSLGIPTYLFDRNALQEAQNFDYAVSPRAVYYALNRVKGLPFEQLKKESQRISPGAYRELKHRPGQYRGDLVSAQGMLLRVDTIPQDPNPIGIDSLYRAYVVDQYDKVFVCLFTEKPVEIVAEEDSVRIYGMFVQILNYPARDGSEQRAPVVVGSRLIRLEMKRKHGPVIAIAVLLILLGCVFAAIVIREMRKDRRHAAQRQLKRMKEHPPNLDEIGRQAEQEAERTKKSHDDHRP